MQAPRVMSTQHPDNVRAPFFTAGPLTSGEDEIQEAFYAYSHLGCDEQMWDFEGKEVDNFVVKKLLTKYEHFFRERKLGQDVRLTFRVPNPEVEKAEAKILLETLESIPRSFDAAKLFYNEDLAPVFEVILPMCSSAESLNMIYHYYKDYVAGKQNHNINGSSIESWIGSFNPSSINVIPLFEDKDHMLNAAQVLKEYLSDKQLEYQRVFLARSDPAVNYGSLSAVLINKIALQRIHKTEEELGIPLYPIIGAGSAPFRGNFRPNTTKNILKGYPSVQTYTVQSSFKFDHSPEDVQKAVKLIHETPRSAPTPIDEQRALDLIDRYGKAYRAEVMKLAPAINKVSKFVPKRRARKLHIGLFGYSRNMENVSLPRAITFTASMYSLGIPPELIGLQALTKDDWAYIKEDYANFMHDLIDPLRFVDIDSPFAPEDLKPLIQELQIESHEAHQQHTRAIQNSISENSSQDLTKHVTQAAEIRGFLG